MAKRKSKKKNKSVVTAVTGGRIFVTPKIAKAQARMAKKVGIAPAGPIKKGIPNDGIIDYTHTIKERPYTQGQAFVKVDGYEVLLKTAKKPLTEKQLKAREARLKKIRGRSAEEKKEAKEKSIRRAARKRRQAKLAAMSKKERDEFLAAEKSRKAKARAKAKLIASGKTEAEATAIMAKRAKKRAAAKKKEKVPKTEAQKEAAKQRRAQKKAAKEMKPVTVPAGYLTQAPAPAQTVDLSAFVYPAKPSIDYSELPPVFTSKSQGMRYGPRGWERPPRERKK